MALQVLGLLGFGALAIGLMLFAFRMIFDKYDEDT